MYLIMEIILGRKHTCQLSVFWWQSPAFPNISTATELVCVQPNLKLCPAILLTEVDMYEEDK